MFLNVFKCSAHHVGFTAVPLLRPNFLDVKCSSICVLTCAGFLVSIHLTESNKEEKVNVSVQVGRV